MIRGKKIFKASIGLLIILLLAFSYFTFAQPEGIGISSNITEEKDASAASSITTPGGSFTTMLLNGTFQTPRWKAYVGNVSGKMTLDDVSGSTIYDWELASVAGEVYVSRASSINWTEIQCITNTTLLAEQSALNISSQNSDNINKTFNETVHKSFLVGTKNITSSSCRAIATYISSEAQSTSENANFQEILLEDNNNNVVFATIIEQSVSGFDDRAYDFQLIVPDNPDTQIDNTYYFFAEIS